MNDSIFFRTSRAERDMAPMPAGDLSSEAVIPLALHRAQVDGAKGTVAAPRPMPGSAPLAQMAAAAETAVAAEEMAQPPVVQPVEPASRSRGRLYLVSRSRGGVGATTFAVSFALGLCNPSRKSERRVAIVDFDLQFGTVASSLDLVDRGGLLALARLDHEPDVHAMKAALQTHESGLSVLPAPRHPVPLDALDATRVRSIVDALLCSHDAVVVDLPPALVEWLEPLLQRADRLFLLTDLAVTSVDCAKRILDTFREDAPDLRVEIVVGRERKPFFAGRVQREISSVLNGPLRHWLPFDPKGARLALDRGEALLEMQPNSGWSRRIRKIVRGLE